MEGVPLKVLSLKVNQLGKGLPSAKVAEYVRKSPKSTSWKALAEIV